MLFLFSHAVPINKVPAKATPVVSFLSLSLNDELFCAFDELLKFLVLLFTTILGKNIKTYIYTIIKSHLLSIEVFF